MLETSEPVNVWVLFKESSLKPHIFLWKGRRIKIEKINLVHTSRNGSLLTYHFSVSANGNFYKLKFESNTLRWFLEAVEEE